mmetsp:Transcript_17572/g.49649  ORF Transcript_17572/g.49649 Transcript_17572/m.49649 type:complete len:160 (-) Transcript_17572:6723-7202(-)
MSFYQSSVVLSNLRQNSDQSFYPFGWMKTRTFGDSNARNLKFSTVLPHSLGTSDDSQSEMWLTITLQMLKTLPGPVSVDLKNFFASQSCTERDDRQQCHFAETFLFRNVICLHPLFFQDFVQLMNFFNREWSCRLSNLAHASVNTLHKSSEPELVRWDA